ncbi:hypothetical protein BHYA_0347g00020 [Botrytis hyacinthi]|uniref:Uncharacterized protein n=1 Tax=Botrytis hyacinthi TaxID=278943 RepID=A0A4Z1G844_9HELO|nr:hypothetical protein BHYA_0347g00020 [Botrytis hyacinthi]
MGSSVGRQDATTSTSDSTCFTTFSQRPFPADVLLDNAAASTTLLRMDIKLIISTSKSKRHADFPTHRRV